MNDSKPEQIGIWRLGSAIQRSAASSVFQAQPADAVGSPRWDYVLKTGSDSQARLGICQSISAGAMVQHPNLIPVLDGDVVGEHAFIVMPAVLGQTMRETLDSAISRPLPVALWLVRQLCQALEAMHAGGWTHRDVKPENVMIGGNGHVTLLDLAYSHEGVVAAEGEFRGTPRYAAPELLTNATMSSPASDMFAVGRILWEWLVKVDTTNESLLSPVCELVERMVDDLPLKRPSAADVTQALLRLEIDTLGQHIGPAEVRRAA